MTKFPLIYCSTPKFDIDVSCPINQRKFKYLENATKTNN